MNKRHSLVEVTDTALLALIENYCWEAGVRNLQKHIEKIYCKIALQLVRQGAQNEPAVIGVDSAGPNAEAEPGGELGESTTGKETQAVAESVESNDDVSKTAIEAEIVQADVSADQATDSKGKKLFTPAAFT